MAEDGVSAGGPAAAPRVKVCGIRSPEDLTIAVRAGADAVGFISGVTHRSEDALDPDRAAGLVARTPPYVSTVLVTHLESAGEILALAATLGVDTIQVHGLIDEDTLREVHRRSRGRWRITRAVHVTGPDAVDAALRVAKLCDAVHLDSRTADRLGGTGRTHDWSISRRIVDALAPSGVPVILSGGLRPANVADAVRQVCPYAVDVNSGVEGGDGAKLLAASVDFVRQARLGAR